MDSSFESLFGANSGYAQELYALYLVDPVLVDPAWRVIFDSVSVNGSGNGATYRNGTEYRNGTAAANPSPAAAAGFSSELQERVTTVIQSYRDRGHLRAKISPLQTDRSTTLDSDELNLDRFQSSDLAAVVRCANLSGKAQASVSEVLERLPQIYCGSIGFEFTHLSTDAQRLWLQERIEARPLTAGIGLSAAARKRAFQKLFEAELFEAQLHNRYVGAKRFSVQGGETVIPMIDALFEHGSARSLREVVFGMAHRGRLGVLCLNLEKPFEEIFSEFEDRTATTMVGSGDVKYHLGHRGSYRTAQGVALQLELLPNPSHLEAINPVVEGVVRARQDALGEKRGAILPVLIHGDAAVMGQGIVPETYNMSRLRGYETGGTVHIVINNQVGFTTDPEDGRSSNYCSEWAKAVEAPVLHVNADDVDAAVWAVQLAFGFREQFGRDIAIDLVCWRKYGHNEADDPSFTQPQLYQEIRELKPLHVQYFEQLRSAGLVTEADVAQVREAIQKRFEEAQTRAKERALGEACPLYGKLGKAPSETGVVADRLHDIAARLVTFPDGFTPHPKLKGINEKRIEALNAGEGIEWGFAETLAFGSIIQEGHSVRISGQDVGRGTFSHRHLQMRDYARDAVYLPLNTLAPLASGGRAVGRYETYNSPLSEEAVMGFEFGYAHAAPQTLVLWEAQFGDFSNGAQIQIDQFLASSEVKWNQRSGLMLLLPHGMEGQGPEHSSARLERYLQLGAENNMMVVYPTTSAQYFHLLRRQALATVKRPLVVMSPKSLLRAPAASSPVRELLSGGWKAVLADTVQSAAKGKREVSKTTIVCTGKVFYDVQATVAQSAGPDVRIVRVEQLYPFPLEAVQAELSRVKGGKAMWVQEEPKNMGAWGHVSGILRDAGVEISCIARPASPSPATGSGKFHTLEQSRIARAVLEAVS